MIPFHPIRTPMKIPDGSAWASSFSGCTMATSKNAISTVLKDGSWQTLTPSIIMSNSHGFVQACICCIIPAKHGRWIPWEAKQLFNIAHATNTV